MYFDSTNILLYKILQIIRSVYIYIGIANFENITNTIEISIYIWRTIHFSYLQNVSLHVQENVQKLILSYV